MSAVDKMSYEPIVELAKKIISLSSISPDKSGTQDILIDRLKNKGFSIYSFEVNGFKNFWARLGSQSPLFVFSGHTDVVSGGDVERWHSPPFTPEVRDGLLFGRGAADMKGSIAAMVIAVENFLEERTKEIPFSIGFLITGDEEIAGAGAEAGLEYLEKQNQKIDFCLVGEPSSESHLGDTVKIGRRGSLHGTIESIGIQGHTGYPHLADNAVHRLLEPLLILTQKTWDEGGEFFQPSTFQLTSIDGGVAANVIPGAAKASFNFRFSIYTSQKKIETQVEDVLKKFPDLKYKLSWNPHADPFLTVPGTLTELVSQTIKDTLGITPTHSTAGGSSDARYFAKKGIQVIEFGPLNESIHKDNEHVAVADLIALSMVYKNILKNLSESVRDSSKIK